MNHAEKRRFLINSLINENSEYADIPVPIDKNGQKLLLRGLLNIRMPKSCDQTFLTIQNEYLVEETAQKGITDSEHLVPVTDRICLWQGDITTLKCDAIVNAANSGMTGCYVPNHRCIDNCIHSFAGVQLRLECAKIMQKQGYPELTGTAKLTSAYNLPCKYVIHTVGPIVSDKLTKEHYKKLEGCYKSCLELAAQNDIESIAFCCISTGEFRFPNDKAAEIAVSTVRKFLAENKTVKKVIFNVFKDTDRQIYEKLLGQN
nr:protein-ADP-ribose hydrolase [uncultured Ruminococcus sp.]